MRTNGIIILIGFGVLAEATLLLAPTSTGLQPAAVPSGAAANTLQVPSPFPVSGPPVMATLWKVQGPHDLNGDGVLDSKDVDFLRACVLAPGSCPLTMQQVTVKLDGVDYQGNDVYVVFLGADDINGDGAVDFTDAYFLKTCIENPAFPTCRLQIQKLTATISGYITDDKGSPIPGIPVVASP